MTAIQRPAEIRESTSRREVLTLEKQRLDVAKPAFTTRRVPTTELVTLLRGPIRPRSGDLVLASVEQIGQHARIERPDGRKARLFVGDEVIVCYGDRYAADQFEAIVPPDLAPCDLVAAGGIAALTRVRHERMRAPTRLRPIGILGDCHQRPVNLEDWALSPGGLPDALPFVMAVVGSGMNAGKTTTVAHLVRGMTLEGLKVGAAKVTGTGSGGDVWHMLDAGAAEVVDFTDAGLASTYRAEPKRLQKVLEILVGHLAGAGMDAIVIEVADGLLQAETSELVSSAGFAHCVDEVIFAAGDAMSAMAGVKWLQKRAIPVSAISGLLTRSPLAMQETSRETRLPVLDVESLSSNSLFPEHRDHRLASRLAKTPAQIQLHAVSQSGDRTE